jgi:6-phosphogluconolactonase (cycloisomerase 2 family)
MGKFKNMGIKIGRGALATAVSLAMSLGVTACTSTYSIGYLYVTSAKATGGLINAYKVDYQTGTLDVLADSPIPSGGRNPVALAANPNHLFLYVVHHDDSDVVLFSIGTDGKLYPQATYDTTGSYPTAVAVDPAGKFLYVTFTYQNGYTNALQGPGGISIFPIIPVTGTPATETLGTPTTVNLGRTPVGITVTSNNFVYAIEQDGATNLNLVGFSENASTGALTILPGQTINAGNVVSTGFPSGVTPSAITSDATGSHLYVTDQAANQVLGYSIAANGVPSIVGTAGTGALPVGLAVDATGKYLYVTNYNAGTVGGYTFGANGQPVLSTVAASTQTGSGSDCVTTIGAPTNSNPSHALYLFASNALSNTVTAEQVNPANGELGQIINSPFGSSTLPTCIVSVPIVSR